MGNVWLHSTPIIAQTSTLGSSDYIVKGCETSEVLFLVYFYMSWAQWMWLLPGANHRACSLLDSECTKLRVWSIKIRLFTAKVSFLKKLPLLKSQFFFFAHLEFDSTCMLTWGCTIMHGAHMVLVLNSKSWSSITCFPLNMYFSTTENHQNLAKKPTFPVCRGPSIFRP